MPKISVNVPQVPGVAKFRGSTSTDTHDEIKSLTAQVRQEHERAEMYSSSLQPCSAAL